ncbi:MAG TPA: sigma-70 family RNA polymerase sigma factor [Devosia sp.]|nr:sigma-70 family RNA polymerase sigma factor [Devosia sp.]
MSGADNDNADEQMTQLLLQVGRAGDVDAFETLFRHFGPRIKAYMAKADHRRAEELMQETMMTVWRKASLFDASRGVAASWIFTIARNQRIDALRRDRRAEIDPDDPALVPETPVAADQALDNHQNAQLMRAALAELPSEQLEVLELAFYQERSQSEIATQLALPLGTVKSRMRLGFAKLRAALGNGGKQP